MEQGSVTMSGAHGSASAEPVASLRKLIPVFVSSLACAYFLAWGLADAREWNARVDHTGIKESAALGVLAAAVGVAAGLGLVFSRNARTIRNLGLRVLASSSTRMMLALTVAVAILLTVKPEGYTFFTAVTVACFGCLLGEMTWAMNAIRRAAGTVGEARGGTNQAALSTGATPR